MKKILAKSFLVIFLLALGAAVQAQEVMVRPANPVMRVRPAAPSPRHMWIEGEWAWRGGRYTWMDGYWVMPRNGMMWIPGHWQRHRRGWYWMPGHWQRRR